MSPFDPPLNPIPSSLLLDPPKDGGRLRSFAGILPARYRHPKDRKALELLRSNGGIDELVRLCSEHLHERAERVDCLANYLRLSPRQLPGLYAICQEVCKRLGVHREIEFFLGQGFNAWTTGVERPCVVIGHHLIASAPTVNAMRFLIGHEIGHIMSEHVHFRQVADWALRVSGTIPMVGGLLQRGMLFALFDWYRASEFTADRAGFLACQDLEGAARFLMTFSGYPGTLAQHFDVGECTEQDDAFQDESQHLTSKLLRFQLEAAKTHPWPIVRTAALSRWSGSEEYAALHREALHHASRAGDDALEPVLVERVCVACRAVLYAGERFCSECGAPANAFTRKKQP